MTEEEARAWVATRYGNAAIDRLKRFLGLLIGEMAHQNLIAASTIDHIWSRHVVDSAQLVAFDKGGLWLDVGTGGGFPGMVVGLLRDGNMLLVEPRRRRADFLQRCVADLQLRHVTVSRQSVEQVRTTADVISARAVASVQKLLQIAGHCASSHTRWLLPRGRSGATELAEFVQDWHGTFHVEQSMTHPESVLIVLDEVQHQ